MPTSRGYPGSRAGRVPTKRCGWVLMFEPGCVSAPGRAPSFHRPQTLVLLRRTGIPRGSRSAPIGTPPRIQITKRYEVVSRWLGWGPDPVLLHTVALVAPLRAALAVPGAAQRFALQLHQALGGKANHLAQECRIRALLQKRTKGDLVVGHRGHPRGRVACRSPTLLRIATVAADRPAFARLLAVPPAGRSAASYTITKDTTARAPPLLWVGFRNPAEKCTRRI